MNATEVTEMLSDALMSFFRSSGWWYDESSQDYARALAELGVDTASAFATFYLHVEAGPTFQSRGRELYQLCWFAINSDYGLDLRRTREMLGLGAEYLPLDNFSGDGGYLYNTLTGQVLELELGKPLEDFHAGRLLPQWNDFNAFLEDFFLGRPVKLAR